MKIGILTFHWATNYGAILQCYALQSFLSSMGHEVAIINYKPGIEDDTLFHFILQKKFRRMEEYRKTRSKEKKLIRFRKRYLNLTRRYRSEKSLKSIGQQYDAIISGSDQVMNDYFLVHGEKGGSKAYFLNFEGNCMKLSYASSFSTLHYPKELVAMVSGLVRKFHAVSAREDSGVPIFREMGRNDAIVVPDPVLLLPAEEYTPFLQQMEDTPYTFVYLLRQKEAFINHLSTFISGEIRTSTNESLEDWLSQIKNASYMVTNSFHGMVFCLKFHIPFTVILEKERNVGMNDRFYTLLSRCHLTNRISTETEFDTKIFNQPIDWNQVDGELAAFIEIGKEFLENNLHSLS